MKKAFFTTRLSDGRKVELSEDEFDKHLLWAAIEKGIYGSLTVYSLEYRKKLVRSHLELGGHLEGK